MIISLAFSPERLNEGIWMQDNVGGSGILVEGTTPEELADNLKQYILDYLKDETD